MKRKSLYLIPLILLALNLLPVALYKDTVGLSGKVPVLQSLTPSHWKLISLDLSFSGGLSTATSSNSQTSSPALTHGATYKGFPFGAYFSNSHSSNTAGATSSYSASAWSWLWATADGLIFVAAMLFVMKLNRPAHQPAAAQGQLEQAPSAVVPAPNTPVIEPTPLPAAPVAMPATPAAPVAEYQPQVITPQIIAPQSAPVAAAPQPQPTAPPPAGPGDSPQ